MHRYVLHRLLLSVGLVGFTSSFREARGDNNPPATADRPAQSVDTSGDLGNDGAGHEAASERKENKEHRKHLKHHWEKEVDKRLRAREQQLRELLHDLEFTKDRVLDVVRDPRRPTAQTSSDARRQPAVDHASDQAAATARSVKRTQDARDAEQLAPEAERSEPSTRE